MKYVCCAYGSMAREPAGGRRRQRREEAAHAQPDDDAERDLELRDGPGLASEHIPRPRRMPPVSTTSRVPNRSESAPHRNAPAAHAEEVEQCGGRDPGPGPAHGLGHGLEEDPQRGRGAHSDAADDDAARDDHPSVKDFHAGGRWWNISDEKTRSKDAAAYGS
jgi:hypothetical protein